MTSKGTAENPFNVLFLCTGNSARSIIAEALMNRLGAPRFRAFSAGSDPKGQVNPHSIALLKSLNYKTNDFRSKSWDEFAAPGAPQLDFVFTVCDNAAGEVCPVWPGQPMSAHWGIEDPAAVTGSAVEQERAFVTALGYLKNRVAAFTALPLSSLDRLSLTAQLAEIGAGEGATNKRPDVA